MGLLGRERTLTGMFVALALERRQENPKRRQLRVFCSKQQADNEILTMVGIGQDGYRSWPSAQSQSSAEYAARRFYSPRRGVTAAGCLNFSKSSDVLFSEPSPP
jgi:hypothetical protein